MSTAWVVRPTARQLSAYRRGKDAKLINGYRLNSKRIVALVLRSVFPAPGVRLRLVFTRAAVVLSACCLVIPCSAQFDGKPLATVNPRATVNQAQFTQTIPQETVTTPPPLTLRRVQVFPRNGSNLQATFQQMPDGENVAVISGGVNLVVQGMEVAGIPSFLGPIVGVDIETDRAVVWTRGMEGGVLGDFTQGSDMPLEIYMEGNIVFRQGDRTVYAERMFYDVRRQVGVILDAELLSPLPKIDGYQYQGLVRLKAAAIRQLDASRFVATDALVTTSRLEDPSYFLGSSTVMFEDIQRPIGDPFTGETRVSHQQLVKSRNNFLYLGDVPVFYWPTITTDLEKPTYYVDNLRVRNDSVFGAQLLLELDMYQLLGLDVIPGGTDWNLDLDLLSERGVGYGSTFEYGRDDLFGMVGPTNGMANAWFIRDVGTDNLGFRRREIQPEKKFRGRAFWNHRQHLVGGVLDGWTAQAEIGWVSDRSFLEQYYEYEWDQRPNQYTGARLKRAFDNKVVSVEANARVNDFFTQTQWLPRGDFYWLGESLLDDTFTFYSHSSVGYANIGVASHPETYPAPPALNPFYFYYLPWEQNAAGNISGNGERLVTRNELDLPLDFSPLKVVPYVLGEAAHWGEDINGNRIDRIYYQGGVRASIPFWAVNRAVRDPIFNLNGLAHKIVFEGEFSYARSDRNLKDFPLYDPLDDNAIQDFRRNLFWPGFGGALHPHYYAFGPPAAFVGPPPFIDPKFDPRIYALRTGIAGWVTSPVTEIAGDLTVARFGMRHRLQTKRGIPGAQRIVDWMTFDANASWFPNAGRDNFGQPIGLVDYDFRWHLGDRFSVLSDGVSDFYGDALRAASLGVLLNRPSRGNAYLGYHAIDAPNRAGVVMATVNYRSTPKWILTGSTSVDVAGSGNVGQAFYFSRIGESLVTTIGMNMDQSKNNVGVNFLIEPRFLPRTNLTRKTSIEIPPAGAFGLE
jgi:hypothetical protein